MSPFYIFFVLPFNPKVLKYLNSLHPKVTSAWAELDSQPLPIPLNFIVKMIFQTENVQVYILESNRQRHLRSVFSSHIGTRTQAYYSLLVTLVAKPLFWKWGKHLTHNIAIFVLPELQGIHKYIPWLFRDRDAKKSLNFPVEDTCKITCPIQLWARQLEEMT